MSVKVTTVAFSSVPNVTADEPHEFTSVECVVLNVIKADVQMRLTFIIREGFKCDGASVPWAFRWFLPSWDDENFIYNLGAVIHDGLYIHRGFDLFTREECDDILRGVWRESGLSRFKAGVADKCIEWFAGGGKHWGNDSYNVADRFAMEF